MIMKGQRYRFRLVALLLVALLSLAGAHSLRAIPLQDSGGSLREAILRLTGRATDSPAPEASPSPDSSVTVMPAAVDAPSGYLTEGLGQILPPDAAVTASGAPGRTPDASASPAPSPGSSLSEVIGQILFPRSTSPPTEAPSDSPVKTVGQILFPQASASVSPDLTPDETNPPEPTPVPPLSEALSSYFGTENP